MTDIEHITTSSSNEEDNFQFVEGCNPFFICVLSVSQFRFIDHIIIVIHIIYYIISVYRIIDSKSDKKENELHFCLLHLRIYRVK